MPQGLRVRVSSCPPKNIMKIEKQSKKGLKTTLNILVNKSDIKKKMDQRLIELQSEIVLKGFRQGKVPPELIKKQFGKAIYGEVIDKILKESSAKAIQDAKIKVAGQPKIDLKTFGEGKDLNYELQIETFPKIILKDLKSFKTINYEIKIDKNTIDKQLNEMSKRNKNFIDRKPEEKAKKNDLVIFDYSATVEGKKFEGSDGKNIQLEIGRELFLKGFDDQLVGLKQKDEKTIKSKLPPNFPKKELANKPAEFKCKIMNVKKPSETKIDNDFAKKMGAKNLEDLKKLLETQIINQYSQSLNAITKKNILDQLETSHNISLPDGLINNELMSMTQNLNKEDKEKHLENNKKIASSRIKLGLILSEYGEKNKLQISDDEVKNEIQKQVSMSPGQEKIIADYYKKNLNAVQSLKGMLFEDKILNFIKSKIQLTTKSINTAEAEKIIKDFNSAQQGLKIKQKTKKISKK